MNPRSLQSLAWAGITAILAVTAWFGWKALQDAKPEAAKGGAGARPPATVIVESAEQQKVVETFAATGTLRAVRRAEVASRESAAVESIAVDEGDLVHAGETLAHLDPRRLEAQIQEADAAFTAAEAELAQREAEHERAIRDEEMMQGLWDERAVAEREYLDSVRERKVAEAREHAAKDAIDVAAKRRELLAVRRADLEIKAPFDGRVVARHSELGEWLREGDPVVTLVSTGEVEAWLQLPERHAALLRTTSPEAVDLHVPGHPEPIRADKLSMIPDVDGRSRRFVLIAHIPDPGNLLTPGSSVEAAVPLGLPEDRVVVDSDAVLKGYAGNYVYVPDDSSDGPPLAKQVPVTVLFERDGKTVLADGALKPGDVVIIEGNERLFPHSPVSPATRGDEPESPATSSR